MWFVIKKTFSDRGIEMAQATIKKSTRNFWKDGREFLVSYELKTHESSGTSGYLIRAHLKEKSPEGKEKETGSCVELLYLYQEVSERIFNLIANAEEPVFPIHLPDIVRDEIFGALVKSVESHF
ncbi:MAG TPA: hypothetical protein GXX30_05490 [Firmicutes bacterium]|nr:hypothetical protein [Candidatus Fermentithermobacillaceae bacterium]